MNDATGLGSGAIWRRREAPPASQRPRSISEILGILLAQRGILTSEEAHAFLHPSLDQLHDPALLPDFEPGAEAVERAIRDGHRIFIHGDFDADGITSTTVLTRSLRAMAPGSEIVPFVPHRFREGYGLRRETIREAAEAGAKLFLTCDVGIAAHDSVAYARELGMTVVVTDHHSVPAQIPDATAVINPKRPDSQYPFRDLAGVGVAFKFVEGLVKRKGHKLDGFYRRQLPFVALGTIADMMPLNGENRTIAALGLRYMRDTDHPGLVTLLENARVNRDYGISSHTISFRLAPRINAAGRVAEASLALRLLLERDPAEALELANQIEAINTERKAIADEVKAEAIALAAAMGDRFSYVIAGEGWHGGVVGLVAGSLSNALARPVVLGTITDGMFRGSARAAGLVDLYDFISRNRDLVGGGGHSRAAGMHFPADQLAEVQARFEAYVAAELEGVDLTPILEYDLELQPEDLSRPVLDEIARLGPFDSETNPEPLILSRNLLFSTAERISKAGNPGTVARYSGPRRTLLRNIFESETELPEAGSRWDVLYRVRAGSYEGIWFDEVDTRPAGS